MPRIKKNEKTLYISISTPVSTNFPDKNINYHGSVLKLIPMGQTVDWFIELKNN